MQGVDAITNTGVRANQKRAGSVRCSKQRKYDKIISEFRSLLLAPGSRRREVGGRGQGAGEQGQAYVHRSRRPKFLSKLCFELDRRRLDEGMCRSQLSPSS